MRLMIITALLLIAGHASAGEQVLIDVQHDSKRQVTCWITPQGGISCLPDGSLQQQSTPSSDAGRASPAGSAHEITSLVATPLPQLERFQL
ncbi:MULTISPECIES: hypothetical protein [unclassified Pseudomonas]|uniref:hypothetical protein n=1 Tax=unclassified Pseudomonas TaxID=196821 RepID=UPI000A1E24CB|nr:MULTISPECIES: hypothetical protein [unclassified Pseudomonas]